jgi:hypothetical protein
MAACATNIKHAWDIIPVDNMDLSFQLLGTVLGAIILVAGLALILYALATAAAGLSLTVSVGIVAVFFGIIVIYAARKG